MKALFEIEVRDERNTTSVWETYRIIGENVPNALVNLHRKFIIDPGFIVTGVKLIAEVDG